MEPDYISAEERWRHSLVWFVLIPDVDGGVNIEGVGFSLHTSAVCLMSLVLYLDHDEMQTLSFSLSLKPNLFKPSVFFSTDYTC